MRRAFFLDPDNYTVRKLLASFYQKLDLDKQALYYDIPTQVVKDETTVREKILQRAVIGNYEYFRPHPYEYSFIIDETVNKLVKQKNISTQDALKHIFMVAENKDYASETEKEGSTLSILSSVIEEKDEYATVLKNILATETPGQPYTAQEINNILHEQGIDKPLGDHLDAFAIPNRETRKVAAIENEVLQIINKEDPTKPYTYKEISELLSSKGIHMHYQLAGDYVKRVAGDSRRRKALYQQYKLEVDNHFDNLISDPPKDLWFSLFDGNILSDDIFQIENKFFQDFILKSIVQSLLARKDEILAAGTSLPSKAFLPDYLQHLQAMDIDQAYEEFRNALNRYASIKKMLGATKEAKFAVYNSLIKDGTEKEDFIKNEIHKYPKMYLSFVYYGVFDRDSLLIVPSVYEIADILTYVAGKIHEEQNEYKHVEQYTFAAQHLLHNLFYEEDGNLFLSSIEEEKALAKAINHLLAAGLGVLRNSPAHDLLLLAHIIESDIK